MYIICAIVNNFLSSYLYLSISMSISYVNTVNLYSHKIKDNKTINIFTQI